MAEGQALSDPVNVGGIHQFGGAKPPPASGAFGLQQMALASVPAEHFATGGDFEALRDRFLSFDTFGTSHNAAAVSKRGRNIRTPPTVCKAFL